MGRWPISPLRLAVSPASCTLHQGERQVLPPLSAKVPAGIVPEDLTVWLSAATVGRRRLQVTVADRWVRYVLLDWPGGLHGEKERETFARLRLRETYGADCAHWPLALPEKAERTSIVAALDPAIHQAVLAWTARQGHRMTAMRPSWSMALAEWRSRLQAPVGAFVRLADKRLTGGIWDRSGWRAVRSLGAAVTVPDQEILRWLGLHADEGRCYCLGWQPEASLSAPMSWQFELLRGNP